MPDVYVSGNKKRTKRPKRTPKDYVSLLNGDGKKRKYHPLSPLMLWPKGIKVEVQDPEEEILLVVRQHPIVNVRWITIVILMWLVSWFFNLFPVFAELPMRFQIMTYLLWYLFMTAIFLQGFFDWYFDAFIVTDERIIDVDFKNLIYKNITYTKIDNIEDVTYSVSGFLPSLLNYGNLLIQTAGPANFAGLAGSRPNEPQGPGPLTARPSETVPTSEILNAPNPAMVVKLINELMIEEEREKIEGRVR